MRSVLGDALVETDEPPPGYSIVTDPRIPADNRSVGRPLGTFRHGRCPIVQSRYPDRLAMAAVAHLRAVTSNAPDAVSLRGGLVIRANRGALVVPEVLWAAGAEPGLVRSRFGLHDAGTVTIDPDDRSTGDIDWWASQHRSTEQGHVTLVAVILDAGHRSLWPETAAGTLAAVATHLGSSKLSPQDQLESLQSLLDQVPVITVAGGPDVAREAGELLDR